MICLDFKKISTVELIQYVYDWHERVKGELIKKRVIYCRMQIAEGLKELIERNIDIANVFKDSDVLDRFKKKI